MNDQSKLASLAEAQRNGAGGKVLGQPQPIASLVVTADGRAQLAVKPGVHPAEAQLAILRAAAQILLGEP
jgi:hypothetical protein